MMHIRNDEVEREIAVDKTEKILEGAMQEFLRHGYAGASMDRVAACAGVSKATVYSYFQDKQGLFTRLIEKLAQERFQSVFGSETLDGDPHVVLRQLATKGLNQMLQDDEYRAFKRVLIGESGRFPELAQLCVRYLTKPTIDVLSQYLAAHPELRIPDPEATAQILIGALVHFQIIQEVMHGKDVMPMESDRLIDALMYLILPDPS